jgi:PEP-CTERM motif
LAGCLLETKWDVCRVSRHQSERVCDSGFISDPHRPYQFLGGLVGSRKRNVRDTASVVLVFFYFLLNATTAKADNVFDISVIATFAPGTTNQVINPTPDFYLTGEFTLDDTTTPGCLPCTSQSATITSFNMVLTPVGGSPYEFSSATGSAQALCANCFFPSFEFWRFSFSDSSASIGLPTIDSNPSRPLAPGGTYYLGAGFTTYPDGRIVYPWGEASAGASFGGVTGVTYGEDLGDILTSGFIYVNSVQAVPEPSTLSTLLVGVGMLLGVCLLRGICQARLWGSRS